MSLIQRFERRLEGMVGTAFARVFKGQVEPVEIGTALQREADDKRAVMGSGQVLSPNRYRVTLGRSDYERLAPWEAQLTATLAELVQEHLDEQAHTTIGDIEVYLALDDDLHTGVFGVASRMEPQAPPRRRPYDSMSMPVVAGHPDEYIEPYQPPAPTYPPPIGSQPPQHTPGGQHVPAQPPSYQQPPYVEPPRRPALRAQLVVDGTPQSARLKPGDNIVGRGTDTDLQLMDQGVSRRHMNVILAEGFATVEDLGSTNGTAVNGHLVDSQQLRHGDVIRVGHTRLVYQEDSS